MRSFRLSAHLPAAIVLVCVGSGDGFAQQHQFELVTGKAFDSAVPKDFYLEGNAIPTAKRNAILVHLPTGERALFSLIDTTGYATDIQAKYAGMMITEGKVTICGHEVTVGSYGFGWTRAPRGTEEAGKFSLYNQAGSKLAECTSPRDANLKQPRPLQVVVEQDGTALLYYGRHSIGLR
jgi:hypothetical protein